MKRWHYVRFRIRKLKDIRSYHAPQSKKRQRAKSLYASCRRNQAIRNALRDFQRRNQGRLPNLSLIPNGDYCFHPLDEAAPFECRRLCPYYSLIEIPEAMLESHPGIVAEGQTAIGACALLGKTDDDFGAFSGLLWDEVKMCFWNFPRR